MTEPATEYPRIYLTFGSAFWCEDRINDGDIPYIRETPEVARAVNSHEKLVGTAEAARKYIINGIDGGRCSLPYNKDTPDGKAILRQLRAALAEGATDG